MPAAAESEQQKRERERNNQPNKGEGGKKHGGSVGGTKHNLHKTALQLIRRAEGGTVSEDTITSEMARRAAADRVRMSVRHGFANGGRVDPKNIKHDPTEAQKKAGNYAKDHVNIHGLDITIENARGKFRRGVDPDGNPWQVKMPAHYGYIKGTVGKDKDHVDVYVGPVIRSPVAFVIDQKNAKTGKFDEHKCFVGFATREQVISTYKKAFSDGKAMARLGHIKQMTIPDFKEWLARGDTTKPIKDAA